MMKKLVKGLIRLYQLTLSRWLGRACRFHPSCSNYTLEAVERHGAFKGSLLGVWRILRCHPFHPGGTDPVPEHFNLIHPRRRAHGDCCHETQ